jgi:arginase
MDMALNIIGMPICYGTDKIGSNFGPDKFREMNILSLLKELGYNVQDLGNIEVAHVTDEHKYSCHKHLKYYDVIIDANTKLAFKVYESISSGNFPVILGGDHSLGMGSIAGVSKHFKNLGVVWIDAHGDLNTHDTTITGNVHGMPLAASMGKGPDKLVNLFEHRIKIKDENIVHIAGRDMDPGEVDLIKSSKIKAFSMENVRTHGADKIIKDSIEYLRGKVDAIHVSFDIDSIDSLFTPGTGTPVKDGLTIDDARKILVALAESGMMVSLDFVELNPLLDNNDETAKMSMSLIKSLFENLNSSSVNSNLLLG